MRGSSLSLLVAALLLSAGPAVGEVAVWDVVDGGNGHGYEFVGDLLWWHDAKAAAEFRIPPAGFLAGHLVTFFGQDEFNFVVAHSPDEAVWIGFTDEIVEGEWRWIDDTPGIWQDPNFFATPIQTAWTNWRPGEPNNHEGNEDYAEMSQGYTWNDGQIAGAPFFYYVEYEPIPEPCTFVLLSLGALAVAGYIWRRRRAA